MKILTFVFLLWFLLPISFLAQGPANTCNQPMQDAVTQFKVQQGSPWQSTVTSDGCWIFVAVNRTPDGNQLANRGIAVLRRDRGKIEQRHFVKVETTGNLALIRNGKILVVSAYPGTIFMDVDKLTSGQSNPEISRVSDSHFLNGGIVAVTRDDRWLFAAQRDTEWLSVANISGLSTSAGARIIGGLATGVVPGLLVLSPDEKFLYLASRVGTDPSWPAVCDASPEPLTGAVKQREGSIQIIDVQRAVSDPSTSVVATIKSGCETRGLAVSPDGRTIYATAMLDNMLLAFDAQPLEKGLPPTLKGKIPVGAVPTSVAGVDGWKTLIVSNANIYSGTVQERQNRKETLTVIDPSKISSGSDAVLGTITVGASPQNLAVTADGRTLLVNNNLGTLDIIDIERLALRSATQATAQQASSSNACNQPAVDPITELKIDGTPRSALPSLDGCWIFLRVDNFTENKTTTSGVVVLRREAGAARLARYISVPGIHDTMAFTPNQKMLIVQADRQIVLLDVAALTSGNGQPIRGAINDVHFDNKGGPNTGSLPISKDGRYLFVSQHLLAWISIIDLQKVEAGISGADAVAGGFAIESPAGIVISSDERYLFITNSLPDGFGSSLKCRVYQSGTVTDPLEAVVPTNAISVVDIGKALSNAASPIVAAVSTGCHTHPLVASPDGKTLYTISRDNTLLAFDTRPVLDDGKGPTLIGTVPVGSLPRDHVVVDGGRKVIVANSNQVLGKREDTETLTVIDAAKIASGAEAVLGTITVGADPRYLSVTHDGRTLLVSNFKSRTLQIIDLDRMPLQPARP
jgi:DNA-binding beta-propeller fold protein YncE